MNLECIWEREVDPRIGVVVEVHWKALIDKSGELLTKILEFRLRSVSICDFLDGLQWSRCTELDMTFKTCENVLLNAITYSAIFVILGNAFCCGTLSFGINPIPDKLHGQTVVVNT